jgi:signal transduction histidine kinase
MLRYTQGKFVSAGLPSSPPPENRRSLGLIRDKDGKLWSSFVSLSLYRLDGNAWVLNGGLSALPATEPDAMLLASDGKLWLGYGADDVRIVSHGRVESYGAKDGLHIGTVTAILPGTWPLLGGELGVSMFTHGAWHSLRASEPQALKGVWGMARSSDGAIWLNSFAGAVRIDASDLDRAALDPSFVISVRVLGDDDGLPGRGQPISPSMAQTTDGKLWYAQDGGLAWIDPLELRRNMYVPRIVVRSVSTPTGSITLSGPVTLPARTTNVRIAYTALSMANPAKNRFKVRLDGIDGSWQEMGDRREVGYTNLRPGNYHFHVKGSNNDGVWNEAGMDLDFRIEPTFFQTSWFFALEILAALLVIFALFRLQVRRATAHERDRVEIRHAEREHLARDLHDSFLQVLSFLILRFDRIGQGMEPGERARLKVDEALDQAETALADGRDRVSSLRDNVVQPTDIEHCLAVLGDELSRDYPTTCSVHVHGRLRKVRPEVGDEICGIGKEALTNAFRHADATHIDVDIHYSWRRVVLIVRDNGKGLPETIQLNKGLEGHWGLVGMGERAKTIGGTLRVRRHPDGGTEVNLRVPAARIYS